jgi:hypothetical protein
MLFAHPTMQIIGNYRSATTIGEKTMSGRRSDSADELQTRSLARWNNEGGAERDGPQLHQNAIPGATPAEDQYDLKVTKVEFADLHARLIALETVTISLLLSASDRQLELAREMADHVSPREGYTPHPLTLNASNHVNQLIDRALRLR